MCFGNKLKGDDPTQANNDHLNSRPVDYTPNKHESSKMPDNPTGPPAQYNQYGSSSNDQYAPPSGPPPNHDQYAPPSGPPPGHDRYAPPPGPPPTQEPYHDWQTAVPDTSLLPPPPAMGNQRSTANNASEEEANQAMDWCGANPLYGPIALNSQSKDALERGEIGVVVPRPMKGTLERLRPGVWKGKTKAGSPDSCILSTVPLYSVYTHSPLQTGYTKTIYYEVRISNSNRNEVTLALGYAAPPYPTFRCPGWHRGSLAVHGDDGSRYVNDMWGGHDFTQPFKPGETVGIGMIFTRRDVDAPPAYNDGPATTLVQKPIGVDVFFTRDGKKIGGWNLHEEGDAEEDLPVDGLEGFHDLLAAVGTFEAVEFDIVFSEQEWMYRP